jgi:hypothetical protein
MGHSSGIARGASDHLRERSKLLLPSKGPRRQTGVSAVSEFVVTYRETPARETRGGFSRRSRLTERD